MALIVELNYWLKGFVSSITALYCTCWTSQVGSVVKNPPASAGDVGLIPGSGRSPGQGNGNLLEHSCLKNPMDAGAWRAMVHGVTKYLDTT